MISIQTNVNSLIAQQNLSVNSAFQSKTIAQLTSGYRINQSGDDAAGLSIANKFRSSIAELTQGVANGNDGVAQLQIMDGGMSNISQILDRLKTLATQSASGTITDQKTRNTLNSEFQTDLAEIDRQAQSIGLNTGGTFAKSLSVYLGSGTGSAGVANSSAAALANSQVTLDLTQSAVDTQSLGLKGMQAASVLKDIGVNSETSVENIVSNGANNELTAGYASMQFTGAGFSDSGKISISVNLSGVTDVATLVTAVNSAIQKAGQDATAPATAFRNANIVASVETDATTGKQALAFSSATSAFQVQAGDQMGNALMGKVSNTGTANAPIATGAAVTDSNTTVTSGSTVDGTFDVSQTVKLVVTGGGLSGPVTLNLNIGAGISTGGAIADLKNQFSADSALRSAGLSMSGSTTPGGRLTFDSAFGQSFNVQVTGDKSNLLGLGSFLNGNTGESDYAALRATTQYSAAALSGTTQGTSARLEVSLNGQAATALTAIDLTAGPSATTAKATGGAIGAGAVDVTATSKDLNITVVNNGVVTDKVFSLSVNQAATNGVAEATIAAGTDGNTLTSAVVVGAANKRFSVAVDGHAAATLTLTAGSYTTGTALAAEINTQIAAGVGATPSLSGLSAAWDSTAGKITLTSVTLGTGSTVTLSDTFATNGVKASGAFTITVATDSNTFDSAVTIGANNNRMTVAVDGLAATTLTLATGSYTTGTALAAEIQTQISADGTGRLAGLTASWDSTAKEVKLTSTNTAGIGSNVTLGDSFATSGVTTGAAIAMSGTSNNTLASAVVVTAANRRVDVAVDGNAAVTLTLATGSYATGTALAAAVQTQIDAMVGTNASLTGLTSTWDLTAHKVTLTAGGSTGTGSNVHLTDSFATSAVVTSGTNLSAGTNVLTASVTVGTDGDGNNKFNIAVDGQASVTLTMASGTYTTGTALVAQINTQIGAMVGTNASLTGISAVWDQTTKSISITSTTTGPGSFISLSEDGAGTGLANAKFTATNSAQGGAASDGALGNLHFSGGAENAGATSASIGTLTNLNFGAGAGTAGVASTSDGALTNIGFSAGTSTGLADAPQTLQTIATAIQVALGGSSVATVTVNNNNSLTIESASKGANSSVTVNSAGTNSANTLLHLGTAAGTGTNSSISDVVENLNAQFSTGVFQQAGLQAAATDVNGDNNPGSNNYIKITSNNNTQFRLNSIGTATAGTAASIASTSLTSGSYAAITVGTNSANQVAITLGSNAAVTVTVAAGTYNTATEFKDALNAAISASKLGSSVTANWDAANGDKLTLTSGNLLSVGVAAAGAGGGLANFGLTGAVANTARQASAAEDLGFGIGGASFTTSALATAGATVQSTGTTLSTTDAEGISNTTSLSFKALQFGSDKQALTFTATGATGGLETTTITLQNNQAAGGNRAGSSIDDAVSYINQQLQKGTSQPALQQIVAVKENVAGAEKINFISKLASFTVGVGSTANGVGVNDGAATKVDSQINGAGANISIDTQAGAKAAITAIGLAVSALGTAQASVGKGQNQLNYAVSLAQSQITNFSAAESQIRDANVAQQAANLSKAQVLSQASIAAMAQANSAPQAVLSLLRG